MPYPELIKAFLAYLISHSGRLDREKRARLLAQIGPGRLALDELAYEALEGTHLRWREVLELARRGRTEGRLFRFGKGFAKPVTIGHKRHPPLPVLEEYLNGSLEDRPLALDRGSLESLIKGAVRDWGLAEVSLHLSTCERCAARIAELRAAELALSPGLGKGEALQERQRRARAARHGQAGLRRRLAYRLLAPVGVALLVVLVNLIFFRHSFLFFRPVVQPSPSLDEESQVVYEYEEWEGFPEDFIPLGRRFSSPWPR